MTKKKTILAGIFLVVVAGLYWYAYKDSFKKPSIEIHHTFRPRPRAARPANTAAPEPAQVSMINFGFLGGSYRLTSLKVVSIEAIKTNRMAEPLWELVAEATNSAPVDAFTYGARIPGMRPIVASARPAPLLTNVPYRIIVQAGPKLRGEHDFVITPENNPAK